ncbi:regulatory protein RecX [Frisingicoccus sp.]|uniref:regulatory protein RecX n=1 Tax=Frisingicoccus sp. TaxID=1918627 RepID=UPI0038662041
MLVSYIEKIGKTKIRVSLEDGDSFILPEREWNRWEISVGQDMSEDTRNQLYRDNLLPKAKMKALNLLKTRDHTYKELIQKLKKDGYPEAVIQETLSYVNAYHYMDDRRYAKNYVAYHGRKKSRKELRYELESKGIDLNSFQYGDWDLEFPDDRITIQTVLVKKWGEDPRPDLKEKERMVRYLARRGFASNDIFSVYRDLGI